MLQFLYGKSPKGMIIIWYLLKCPEGKEMDYVEKYRKMVVPEDIEEITCIQYQRMLRYSGNWHLEKKVLLPGYIFLSAREVSKLIADLRTCLIPCEVSQLKALCSEANLIGMSKGIIKNRMPVVTNGPLKGRECLIQKIDRHKRIAEIKIPLTRQNIRMMVGLEIYEKQA